MGWALRETHHGASRDSDGAASLRPSYAFAKLVAELGVTKLDASVCGADR